MSKQSVYSDDETEQSYCSEISDIRCEENEGELDEKDNCNSYRFSETDADNVSFEKLLNENHLKACKALSQKQYNDSLLMFERILSDIVAVFGGSHKRVGAALHNLAIAYLRVGKLDNARDAIEEAIKIRSKCLGKSSMKVVDSLIEYGIILLSQREYEDSIKVFEEALVIRENISDGNEDKTLCLAKLYNNIGCVYFEKYISEASRNTTEKDYHDLKLAEENFDKSINYFNLVYDMWDRFWRNNFAAVDTGYLAMASAFCNKAYIELERKKYSQATKYFKKSLEIQKELLGNESKLVQDTLYFLGNCLIKVGDTKQALQAYESIMDGQTKSEGTENYEKILTLKRMVYCKCRLGDNEAALKHLVTIEDLIMGNEDDCSTIYDNPELEEVRQLMGEVNYEVFKFSFTDFCCSSSPADCEVKFERWHPPKPKLCSKMSSHKLARV